MAKRFTPNNSITSFETRTLMKNKLLTFLSLGAFLLLSACSPKVQVEVPDKPITINLNVKVEHEIRVKVDKELDALFEDEDGLF